ncbi:general transcription factor IIF subunit 1 isoform X2 [Nematostella vectensis]|uniref:general transcription factor IIF subunit 1 isoform X2 n=1 Tax=Nematostella vectensis TaxID=45351 RepID=UPI002076FF85|nr:general transcription factor IIF subunit 1 isoform X2 [Nematostella vectensis]
MKKVTIAPVPINPAVKGGASRIPASATPSTADASFTEYKVRVPRNLAKKYSMMRFQSGSKVDFSSVSKANMNRMVSTSESKEEEAMPTHGAGSEYGREWREEARKRRRGYMPKTADPKSAPWALKIGGKAGKRYTGKKEAGINDNSNYYILTQCPDGAFEAVPVDSWYNFTPNIHYHTLNAEEAEEEFNRRDKTVNFFSLMVKKRLQSGDDTEGVEDSSDSKAKLTSLASSMKIHDNDDLDLSDDDDDNDDDDNEDDNSVKKEKKTGQQNKKKGKSASKAKKNSDDESEASSEDGYIDSKEVDYMSDTSSSSEEEVNVETPKPDAQDDLNAETSESESEEDAELTNAGRDIKKMLEKDQGEGGSSGDEDDDLDADADQVKGPSALFLQDKRIGKKKPGSRSSTESSSRSSTPTAGTEGGTSTTIAAAARKLGEGRPGTPSKAKKRPASEPPSKKGFHAINESPAAKKLRVSPGPSSGTSTPTPGEDGQAITEESIRRYLARKPMTTKDLLQKFKTKRTGLTNEQTVQLIATILKRIQPEQKTIKGKMYLSLKST